VKSQADLPPPPSTKDASRPSGESSGVLQK